MLKKLIISGLIALVSSAAFAEENVSVHARMVPQESMKMNFSDGTKHFVLLVHREGKSKGVGALANASVTEYGWHDINPPQGGHPQGYLQFKTENGDIANIKFTVRAVFLKGDKKPRLADYGFWELVSGTGHFKGLTGVGSLTIHPASKTDRTFTLNGEIGPKP